MFKERNILAITALSVSISGCGGDIKEAVDDIVEVVDNAVYTLDQNSAEYQNILEDLIVQIDTIDKDVSKIIRGDINTLLVRTPAVLGQEFRCDVDFVSTRVKQGLKCALSNFMIGNLYSGSVPNPGCTKRMPTVCSIVPSSIEQELDPSVINVYGYDFDMGVKGWLIDNESERLDVSEYIAMPSHYNLTLNLGNNGVPDIYGYDYFELLFQNETIASAAIIQGSVCSQINPGTRTINYDNTSKIVNVCSSSDWIDKIACSAAVDNVEIFIDTSIEIDHQNNRIVATTQTNFESIRFEDSLDVFTLYQAPPNMFISEISVESKDTLNFVDTDNRINYVERGNFGLVNQYELKLAGFLPGNGSGYSKIKYNRFDVCVSPN